MEKPSCRKTALNRCTRTESRWNKKNLRDRHQNMLWCACQVRTWCREQSHWEDRASQWLLGERCTVMVDWNTWPFCVWLQFLLRRLTLVPMPRHRSRQSCKWQSHPKLPAYHGISVMPSGITQSTFDCDLRCNTRVERKYIHHNIAYLLKKRVTLNLSTTVKYSMWKCQQPKKLYPISLSATTWRHELHNFITDMAPLTAEDS